MLFSAIGLSIISAGCHTEHHASSITRLAHFSGEYTPISSVDEAPILISSIEPEYPNKPKAVHNAGEALVSFIVNTDGIPVQIQWIRATNQAFAMAAIKAVSAWRFRAAQIAGRPTACSMTVPIIFDASTGSTSPALSASDIIELTSNASRLRDYRIYGINPESKSRARVTLTHLSSQSKALLIYYEKAGTHWKEISREETQMLIP
jgi:TonB family protein